MSSGYPHFPHNLCVFSMWISNFPLKVSDETLQGTLINVGKKSTQLGNGGAYTNISLKALLSLLSTSKTTSVSFKTPAN